MNFVTQFNLKPFWTDKLLLIYSGWYRFHTGRKQFHVQYYKTIIFCTFLNCRASFLGNSTLFSVEPDTLQFTVNHYFPLTAFPSPLCEGTHTHSHIFTILGSFPLMLSSHTTRARRLREGTGRYFHPPQQALTAMKSKPCCSHSRYQPPPPLGEDSCYNNAELEAARAR